MFKSRANYFLNIYVYHKIQTSCCKSFLLSQSSNRMLISAYSRPCQNVTMVVSNKNLFQTVLCMNYVTMPAVNMVIRVNLLLI